MKGKSQKEKRREPPPMLPVGALVEDGDAAGVVVGAFEGPVGDTFYVYVTPTGEVGGQYGGGLRLAGGGVQGGLPDVIDIAGRDPLAALREAVSAPPAIPEGLAGLPAVIEIINGMPPTERTEYIRRLKLVHAALAAKAKGRARRRSGRAA